MEPQVAGALRSLREALASSQAVARVAGGPPNGGVPRGGPHHAQDVQEVQQEILERTERGEEVPQELVARYQHVTSLAAYNPYIRELFEAEAELLALLNQIQRELLEAVGLMEGQAPPQGQTGPRGTGAGGRRSTPCRASFGCRAKAPPKGRRLWARRLLGWQSLPWCGAGWSVWANTWARRWSSGVGCTTSAPRASSSSCRCGMGRGSSRPSSSGLSCPRSLSGRSAWARRVPSSSGAWSRRTPGRPAGTSWR